MPHTLTDGEAQELLDLGVKAWEIIRLGFPDADQALCKFLLWEKTPFPLARGVHDIADSVALLVAEGPRCGEPVDRRPYVCRRKVRQWGDACHAHRPAITVKRARPGGVA